MGKSSDVAKVPRGIRTAPGMCSLLKALSFLSVRQASQRESLEEGSARARQRQLGSSWRWRRRGGEGDGTDPDSKCGAAYVIPAQKAQANPT